jgi:hypothetical protein
MTITSHDVTDLINDTSCACCEHDAVDSGDHPCRFCINCDGDLDNFERHEWLKALAAERERVKKERRIAMRAEANHAKATVALDAYEQDLHNLKCERDAAIERAKRAEECMMPFVCAFYDDGMCAHDEPEFGNCALPLFPEQCPIGPSASLKARAEAAEAWQRAVAKELGWCEELGEAIPDADFMATIARTHGESHLRLEGAEAEVERLRSGSKLYETVLELEADVERLRGDAEFKWRFIKASDHIAKAKEALYRAAQRGNPTAIEEEALEILGRTDTTEYQDRITKALGILEGAVKAPWNRQTLSEAARGVLHDAIAALKGEDTP